MHQLYGLIGWLTNQYTKLRELYGKYLPIEVMARHGSGLSVNPFLRGAQSHDLIGSAAHGIRLLLHKLTASARAEAR